jgi:hypothetical protein
MAVTGTKTVRDIVSNAFKLIGVVAEDEAMTADEGETGLYWLDVMLKDWQSLGYNLWTYTEQTLTLTTAASYTLNPVRPIRIIDARLVRSGLETPMMAMTRTEYDLLPNKASTGLPTTYYYDRQREAALFYVWPVLATADGSTVKITYERELEDVTSLNDTLDMPGEWWAATTYNLAAMLADAYERNVPKVDARAGMLLERALAGDREGSVFFT